MSPSDPLWDAVLQQLEHPPMTGLRAACDALAELGLGLAAVVDLMDGGSSDWTPGPALVYFAADSPPGSSLLGDVARALAGEPP
jgi:hypothetical protein